MKEKQNLHGVMSKSHLNKIQLRNGFCISFFSMSFFLSAFVRFQTLRIVGGSQKVVINIGK